MATQNAVNTTLSGQTGTGSFVGSSAPTLTQVTFSTTSGIIGTATNDNAAAGSVGEYVSSAIPPASAIGLTTVTAQDITSISLTAGDWDVFGVVGFTGNATTIVTNLIGWTGMQSATLDTGLFQWSQGYSGGSAAHNADAYIVYPVPARRISIASTTTIYLSAYSSFTTSVNAAFGSIFARRVR